MLGEEQGSKPSREKKDKKRKRKVRRDHRIRGRLGKIRDSPRLQGTLPPTWDG
jgi:hypothetical protein